MSKEELWESLMEYKIIDEDFKIIFDDMLKTIKAFNAANAFNFAITGVHVLVRFTQLLKEMNDNKKLKVVYPSKNKLEEVSEEIKQIIRDNPGIGIHSNDKHHKDNIRRNQTLDDWIKRKTYSTFNGDIGAGEFNENGQLHNLIVSHPAQLILIKKHNTQFINGWVGQQNYNREYGPDNGKPSEVNYHVWTAKHNNWNKKKNEKIEGGGQASAFNNQAAGVFGINVMGLYDPHFDKNIYDINKIKQTTIKQLFNLDGLTNHLPESPESPESPATTFANDIHRFFSEGNFIKNFLNFVSNKDNNDNNDKDNNNNNDNNDNNDKNDNNDNNDEANSTSIKESSIKESARKLSLHLSDVFKADSQVSRKNIIEKIENFANNYEKRAIKIKLLGSFCIYFRIPKDAKLEGNNDKVYYEYTNQKKDNSNVVVNSQKKTNPTIVVVNSKKKANPAIVVVNSKKKANPAIVVVK